MMNIACKKGGTAFGGRKTKAYRRSVSRCHKQIKTTWSINTRAMLTSTEVFLSSCESGTIKSKTSNQGKLKKRNNWVINWMHITENLKSSLLFKNIIGFEHDSSDRNNNSKTWSCCTTLDHNGHLKEKWDINKYLWDADEWRRSKEAKNKGGSLQPIWPNAEYHICYCCFFFQN